MNKNIIFLVFKKTTLYVFFSLCFFSINNPSYSEVKKEDIKKFVNKNGNQISINKKGDQEEEIRNLNLKIEGMGERIGQLREEINRISALKIGAFLMEVFLIIRISQKYSQ